MRIALTLLPALGLALGLAACSSSSGGGSSAPAKTYIIMPNGQTTQGKPCGGNTGTACP
jgi:ABC-type glycerol-3-phosphate transport system substrate-binding protein